MTGFGDAVLDALLGFIGGLLSGIIGGYYAARAGVSYQQRAIAVAEIRQLVLDASRTFHEWAWRMVSVGERDDYYLRGFYEIVAKVDVLGSSYGIHAEWLSGHARESVEKIIEGISDHNSRLMETAGEDEEMVRETANAARQWHDQDLLGLIDNIRALPRWRARLGRR
jgi:hypothetical protein